jgi:sulfide dehydrogenase cytochrome subunit
MQRIAGLILALVLLSFFTGQAFADTTQGERLSRTCAGCHGTAGASPGKLIPIIGGQLQGYTLKALQGFAVESRPGSVMLKLAKGYSEEEQKQIATYFAAQPWVSTSHAVNTMLPADLAKRCQGCHGKKGKGKNNFPRIAGQHPEYLFQALLEYQQGERNDSLMMLTRKMDETTLQKLADAYAAIK